MSFTRFKPIVALGATILASTLILTGCGGQQAPSASSDGSVAPTGGALNVALQGEVTTYDPWSAQSGLNGSLFSNHALYDSLVHLDENGQPTPWLATKWESADSSHYTLTLRDDVKFSDGTALDANAVVKNFEYAAKAQTPGECNTFVAGATATAKDATTVDFALKTPSVGFMTDLGSCASFIVNPTALENPDSLKTTPAGSGPYTLDASSVAGQKWVYKKRADYWDAATYAFDTINISYFKDSSAQENAAKAGQVDFLQTVNPDTDTSGLKLLATSTDFRGIMFQDVTGKIAKPLADPKVRQALQMAVDREAIQKAIFPNSGVVAYSTPFTETSVGFTEALKSTFPYDQAKAKQMLADAGYPSGFSVKVMTVGPMYGDASQAIAGQLEQIGVKLELSDQSSDFFNQLKSGKWPMINFNWSIGTNPIHTYEGLTSPDGFWNTQHNTSPAIDALLTQLAEAKDDAAKLPILENIAKEFQNDSWYLVPVMIQGHSSYNDKKLAITTTKGAPIPFLYQIKPVG